MDYPKSDPSAGLLNDKFTDGDPVNGLPASKDSAAYQNMVFDSLIELIIGAGLVPDEAKTDLIFKAVQAMSNKNASLTEAGIAQLSNSLSSDSQTKAATSLAVKNLNDALLLVDSLILIGAPVPWPTDVVPTGYLEMRGQAFDPVAFPKLAIAYPTNTLIDMRGEFIRGWDNGRGVDISRVICSSQLDEFKSHQHDLSQGPLTNGDSGNQNQYASWWKNGGLSSADGTYDTGGSETRPRNISFMYITRAA